MAVSSGGRSHALLDPRGQVWIQCHLGPTGLSACKDWGLLESWYPKPATTTPPHALVLKVESTRQAVLGSGMALSGYGCRDCQRKSGWCYCVTAF